MNTITRGLHTCKPGNTPTVGQVKSFVLLDMGDWTKIKSEKPDKGGSFFRIISVEKTSYSDAHGNISFNLEVEPAAAPAGAPPPLQPQPPAGTPPNGFQQGQPARRQDPQPPQTTAPAADSAESFVMRSANLYCLCLNVTATTIRDRLNKLGFTDYTFEDIRQIATTMFLHAKDHGYVQHMSDKEKKEPY